MSDSLKATDNDEWTPPRLRHGRIELTDWQPTRAAIDAARRVLGQDGPIPKADWNLVALAIEHYRYSTRTKCSTCGDVIAPRDTIRCLDCRLPLCPICAPKHFWPNACRPKASH